jgi:TolA-binding protein
MIRSKLHPALAFAFAACSVGALRAAETPASVPAAPVPAPVAATATPGLTATMAVGGAPAPVTASALAPPAEVKVPAAAAPQPPTPAPVPEVAATPPPPVKTEARSLIDLGDSMAARADYSAAETAYLQAIKLGSVGKGERRDATLALARMLRRSGGLAKAVAVYQKFLKDYPVDDEIPAVYLELGRAMRALGSHQQAIACFYSVINATLKLTDNNFASYRQLAKTAQFEIAETLFEAGDFAEASRFFGRLKLLDLAPADRARAQFKSADALYLAGDFDDAIVGLRGYVDQNPGDENIPEARYLLAMSLRRRNRLDEAYLVTLDLLREERTRTAADPKTWAYWQRRTGNQLANEYYEQGDFTSALAIYEGLAQIASDVTWRLPVEYQAGLCEERLGQPDEAARTYQGILAAMPREKGEDTAPAALQDVARMATWRLDHLKWQNATTARVADLFKNLPPVANAVAPAGLSGPAVTHDANGSTAKSPAAL